METGHPTTVTPATLLRAMDVHDHNIVLRDMAVHVVGASVVCDGVSISHPSAAMADTMMKDIQALQEKQIPQALADVLVYPAVQRVALAFDLEMPSTAEGAREELDQVSEPFSLPLHPHIFNSSADPLQHWFALYTPAWCSRVAQAFHSHPLGPPTPRPARGTTSMICVIFPF